MKLKNKKTGEIVDVDFIYPETAEPFYPNFKLVDFNELFEDYEEPKDNDYWYIDDFGRIKFSSEVLDEIHGRPNNWMALKLFGNYFETKEEAEKVVEKLKAWQRLKDKGFKFIGVRTIGKVIDFVIPRKYCGVSSDSVDEETLEFYHDLDLLFGGQE